MGKIQRKLRSHLTVWQTLLQLLLTIVLIEKIVPVGSSSNYSYPEAPSSLLLAPGPDRILVSWTPDDRVNGTGSNYTVAWSTDGRRRGDRFVGEREERVRKITGLKPCTNYDISVTTREGSRTTLETSTTTLVKEPLAAVGLAVRNITAHSLALSWERPATACEITAYNITYSGVAKWGPEHTGISTIGHGKANSTTTIVIAGLQPYTEYTVTMAAYTAAGEGEVTNITTTTLEGVPSKATDVRTNSEVSNTIIVTWGKPKQIPGVLGRYNISWHRKNEALCHKMTNNTIYIITELSPCEVYTVRVAATTGAGEGEYVETKQLTMGILQARGVNCSVGSKSKTLTVTWLEHDTACPITGYDVIDRIANTTHPVSSTIHRYNLGSTSLTELSKICVVTRRGEDRGNSTCCSDKNEDIKQERLMIILGAILGVVTVVLLVMTLCHTLWKHSAESISTSDKDYYTNLMASVRQGIESMKHPAAAAGHFENLNKESYVGEITVAMRAANKNKNLYSNVLPFDSNRVLLKRVKKNSTDYINASFVKSSVDGDVSFIACQSPKSSTVDDFWWMVWEQGVRTIVMLVRSDEQEKTKSIQYWPGPGQEVCSSFSITIVKKQIDYTLVKRTIQLSRGREKRTLKHFQLVSWPEFGVPNTENELLMLMRDVREHVRKQHHQVVVHCSAGVGQTGTFIGLWQLQVKADRMLSGIDVRNTVLGIRKHRQMLVQRPVQYKFLHDCFLAYLHDMQIWKPGSGRTMSTRRRRSSNKRLLETKESSVGTELRLLPQHPDFGPLPPLPPSATSDDYATKDELDSYNPYYYPDISDEMKDEILSGTT